MRNLVYPLLVIIVVSGLYFGEKWLDKRENTIVHSENTTSTTPENSLYNALYFPESTTGIVVEHHYYTLSYHSKYKQAEWVAYRLHPSHLTENSFKRPYFETDNQIPGGSAHWHNYRNSGYDRGHLCPAGDRRFSYEAYRETFLTSNISPQNRSFNSGIWNRLEIQIRNWAAQKNELLVITGGVLKEGLKTIGDDKISVPEYFYKIVVAFDKGTPKAIAFLIPNENRKEHIATFVTPIPHLETLTGLHFFNRLPSETEAALKAPADYNFWNLRKKI